MGSKRFLGHRHLVLYCVSTGFEIEVTQGLDEPTIRVYGV